MTQTSEITMLAKLKDKVYKATSVLEIEELTQKMSIELGIDEIAYYHPGKGDADYTYYTTCNHTVRLYYCAEKAIQHIDYVIIDLLLDKSK